MIHSSKAKSNALIYLKQIKLLDDAMLLPWRRADLDEPFLVHDVDKSPSFWIVPVMSQKKVLGYIEVALDGSILGHSYLYQNPDMLDECPDTATRLTSQQVLIQAESVLKTYANMEIDEPFFVHDGPRSRLAWMIEVHSKNRLISRVFATPGYIYERKADVKQSDSGLRGG